MAAGWPEAADQFLDPGWVGLIHDLACEAGAIVDVNRADCLLDPGNPRGRHAEAA